MKANHLLLAVCALFLPLAGCKSSGQTATDAATSDTSATPDAAQSDATQPDAALSDGAQPDAAPDGIITIAEVAPSPADKPPQPDVNGPNAASDAPAETVAADARNQDAVASNDLADDPASIPAKDATTDLRAPAADLAADLPAADGPGADRSASETSSDAGCSGWTTLKRLSPAEVADLIATSNPIVINVHYPYAGDIPGTDTSIHYDNVDAIEAYLNHDHCADVLLVCLSGGMSQSAGNELIKRGYLRVRDLDGGMQAWQAAGYPLLKDGGP